MSPQTGHGSPARPCTCSPLRFSPFRVAACCPTERATASLSTALDRRVQRADLGVGELGGELERGQARGVQDLVGVGVADAGEDGLVGEGALDLDALAGSRVARSARRD